MTDLHLTDADRAALKTVPERIAAIIENGRELYAADDIAAAILEEITVSGFDMIEHVELADPTAPIGHAFTVIPDEDSYFIRYPDLPGCMTQAETLYEIGPMAQDAYVNWTAAMQEDGRAIPEARYE